MPPTYVAGITQWHKANKCFGLAVAVLCTLHILKQPEHKKGSPFFRLPFLLNTSHELYAPLTLPLVMCRIACNAAKNEHVCNCIGAQAVRAMEVAGNFTCCIETGDYLAACIQYPQVCINL